MSADIAPDVNCPHCGMVITCAHTLAASYPPRCINPRPAPPDVPDEVWKYFGHTRPGGMPTAPNDDWSDYIDDALRAKAASAPPRPTPTTIAQPGHNPAYVEAAIRGERGLPVPRLTTKAFPAARFSLER